MHGTLKLAVGAAFGSMAVVFILKTLADTVFLAEFGVTYVPHFFVAQSLLVVSSSAAYGALIKRRSPLPWDLVILGGLAAVALAAPMVISRGGPWVFVVSLVLISLSSVANAAVWNAATAAARGRRSRAFLPTVSAAATAGAMAGGFVSSSVVATAGVVWLGPVAAGILAALAAAQSILARGSLRRQRSEKTRKREQAARRATSKMAGALVAFISAAAVIEAVLAGVIDFGFKEAVTSSFDREEIGLFLALFYGGSNVFVLILQLLVTTRLLAFKPLRTTLSIQPIAMFAAAAAWIAWPALALASLARACEAITKFGIARPAQEVALSPLTHRQKQRAKVLVRGVYSQIGAVAVGLLLVVFTPWLVTIDWLVPTAVLLLAAVWLWLYRQVSGRYVDTLAAALGLGRLSLSGPNQEPMLDADGISRVVEMLGDADPAKARFGSEVLSSAVTDTSALVPHLGIRDRRVRRVLYQQFTRSPSSASIRALREAVLAEESGADDGSLEAGLTALARHGDDAAVDLARSLVAGNGVAGNGVAGNGVAGNGVAGNGVVGNRQQNRALTRSAWAYLGQVGALDDDPEEHRRVLRSVLSVDGLRAAAMYEAAIERESLAPGSVDGDLTAAMQITTAETTGMEVAIPQESSSGDGADREPIPGQTAAEAFRAAAHLGRSQPLIGLLKALESKRPGAERALTHLTSASLARLMLLSGARKVSSRTRRRIIRGLRRCELPESADVAARALHDDDPRVRETAVRTLLHKAREGEMHIRRQPVEAALARARERFRPYVHARAPYSRDARESSIAFRHHGALALEAAVFFIDELERQTEKKLTRVCDLLALLGNPNEIYSAARELRAPTLKRRLRAMDILQEVATGAKRAGVFELLECYLQPKTPTKADLDAVCELDPWLERCRREDLSGLRLRILGLRASPLFDGISGDAVIELAQATSECSAKRGEIVVKQGEQGDALYVVMSGWLVVERNDKEIGRIETGDVFGELSLLDEKPRYATVRATSGGVRLLRLPRGPFREALAKYPEIRIGLLLCLTNWLRKGPS